MTEAVSLEPDAIQPTSSVGLGSASRSGSARIATQEAAELYEAWAPRVRG